jgi:actin-related protein 6
LQVSYLAVILNLYINLLNRKPFAKNTIIQEYVLPDFINNTTGHIRTKADKPHLSDQQILAMNNERFMIPEILMHPSDIGLEQAGIPEAIAQSVNACDSGTSTTTVTTSYI